MNKYLIASAVIIGAVGIYFLIPKESIKNPLPTNEEEKTYERTSTQTKVIHQVKNISQKSLQKKVEHTLIDKQIEDIIINNDLQSIKKVGDLEIFAKNLPQKNEFAPPSPPVLVKLKFKDKEEILPLDSDLVSSNSKIFIVKEKDGKYNEIKEIDTKKLQSFTPPVIGQN